MFVATLIILQKTKLFIANRKKTPILTLPFQRMPILLFVYFS